MNLFGIIRQSHFKCWKEIQEDPACWDHCHTGPLSFHKAKLMYSIADDADFGSMCAALHERSIATPKTINLYHEWIALYMCSDGLTDEEMKYRQSLARRMNE